MTADNRIGVHTSFDIERESSENLFRQILTLHRSGNRIFCFYGLDSIAVGNCSTAVFARLQWETGRPGKIISTPDHPGDSEFYNAQKALDIDTTPKKVSSVSRYSRNGLAVTTVFRLKLPYGIVCAPGREGPMLIYTAQHLPGGIDPWPQIEVTGYTGKNHEEREKRKIEVAREILRGIDIKHWGSIFAVAMMPPQTMVTEETLINLVRTSGLDERMCPSEAGFPAMDLAELGFLIREREGFYYQTKLPQTRALIGNYIEYLINSNQQGIIKLKESLESRGMLASE